ncbi:MAG: hypothetical protein RI559_11045 [Marinospirillum sp.]|nr:hypothetical protein [Marinospirillum sp.]
MNLVISDVIREKLASKHGVTEAEVRQCFENREHKTLVELRTQHLGAKLASGELLTLKEQAAMQFDEKEIEKWEKGELGLSPEHTRISTDEEDRALDDAMGMQPISIRLQKKLIADLKRVAGGACQHSCRV